MQTTTTVTYPNLRTQDKCFFCVVRHRQDGEFSIRRLEHNLPYRKHLNGNPRDNSYRVHPQKHQHSLTYPQPTPPFSPFQASTTPPPRPPYIPPLPLQLALLLFLSYRGACQDGGVVNTFAC
ncbi:hypothetical protein L873DRAFT_897017 [Choiromyces venosus 120613-1]|uniref:Uncharacterized protein n=1 Tax=Choiromyces venosus 120613-1 TaxID=1336337 RepID=A0A3N4JMZ4_9PEZI|nr:hypothetical protein L873DRAFT_897017 [Choiromyces venosus 120613-1]